MSPRSLSVSLSIILAMAPLASVVAHVHHGSNGSSVSWYPNECCHDGDCHPVSRIQSRSDGLLMTTDDGTTLLVNALKARRPSHDSRWHVCFGANEVPEVLCVFEPPGS